jgi:energy-coupling factor transporter transmembrane protein EcfT
VIFGILYPHNTILARVVGASTAILFPILGVLVFTTPAPWSDLCGLGRFLFFVLGFFLSAIVYWNRPKPAAPGRA